MSDEIPRQPDLPYVALRPDLPGDDSPMPVLDDVVVDGHITMFRAEMMDDNNLWMALYLDTGEDIHFSVSTKRAPIRLLCTALPSRAVFEEQRRKDTPTEPFDAADVTWTSAGATKPSEDADIVLERREAPKEEA